MTRQRSPLARARHRETMAVSHDDRFRDENARDLLAAIVEASAIIAKALDGTILSWNHGAERLYGYRADEVIRRPVSLLVPPDQEDEVPRLLEAVGRGERVDHYETVPMRKDGTRVHVSLMISPTRDRAGRIVGEVVRSGGSQEKIELLASIVDSSDERAGGSRIYETTRHTEGWQHRCRLSHRLACPRR